MQDHFEIALQALPQDRGLTVYDVIGGMPPRRRATVREASTYLSRMVRCGRLRCVGVRNSTCFKFRQYRRA